MARIAIAAPIRPGANSGNDVTAARWANHLETLGHETVIVPVAEDNATLGESAASELADAHVLIALHARRSAPAASWWTEHRPGQPLIVGLAGTDLYRDMPDSHTAAAAVAEADALIVLQEDALDRLREFDPAWADKAAVIHQSVSLPLPERRAADDEFRVVVLAHLRDIKDPLLTARAARLLPGNSRVAVHHAGRALDGDWQQAAETEEGTNDRYTWHRELGAEDALALLASAHVLACTSLSEGGANVVTEAIALGIPVIGTRIAGNTGLLGSDHPGWFPVGHAEALAELLLDLETNPELRAELERRSLARKPITDPSTEQAALEQLIARVFDS
ncbi:MAG: putative glycosyltransferase (TIGR04348 family) [Candidatus Aldehydirespiratoraceae bacterium]|jgi:putative glycosyltransferase (TIGR04348 family)